MVAAVSLRLQYRCRINQASFGWRIAVKPDYKHLTASVPVQELTRRHKSCSRDINMTLRGALTLLLGIHATALVTPPRRRQPTLCQAKKKEKKGFDYKPPPKPPAKKALTDDVGVAAATTPEGNSQLLQTLLAEEKDRAQVQTEAMEDLKERDAYVAEKGVEAARVPDAVANRMILRMATFGGVPVFLGIGVFVWFYFQATNEDNVFQPTAVAAATTVPWVLGLLGIGFGALSASWDEEDEGSALGVDEIKLNVGRLVDGVQRSAKDELMREKMDKE